ncbi:MarR family transcriptional regulator [Saccharomonospora sp. NPDC046836]|uniref:MarR family winged helix-turn-helix transcriptional regulator n=1 Tax=Saccharomonospora sp. NPDC046836 TaxID=3156921 RepID=UPI0033F7FAF1
MDARVDQLRRDLGLFARNIRSHRRSRGLTASQLQVLGHLDIDGAMTARDLSDRERVAPQSVAKTIKALEATGMVSRRPDPDDARAVLIEITDDGRSTLVSDRAARNEWLESALAHHCTEAERELLYIAGRILRELSDRAAAPDDTENGLT